MSYEKLIFWVVIIFFIYNTFNARKLRHKIRCRYTSITKQSFEKVVDAKSNVVLFEYKKFYIVSSCVKHRWWDEGMQWFSPMFMPEIDFVYNSEFPVNPNTGQPIVLKPEVAGIYREAESFQAYAGGQQNEMAKSSIGGAKLSGISKYLPWIAIAAVVLVAIYFYQQNQSTKAALNVVELNLQKILIKIGGD